MTAEYLVLPVSVLKAEVSRIFEALGGGHMVYVSKHGDIVAAFRPFDVLSPSLVAAYAAPTSIVRQVTAREMGQAVPSGAIADAAAGLPSLVTRNRQIYGVITAASVPRLTVTPDNEAAAARSEAMRQYLVAHPNASVEDIAAMRRRVEASAVEVATEAWPMHLLASGQAWTFEDVVADLAGWEKRGSTVEPDVRELIGRVTDLVERCSRRSVGLEHAASGGPAFWKQISAWRDSTLSSLEETDGTISKVRAMEEMREGARLATDDPVLARSHFVRALVADFTLNNGAMWALGELARRAEHFSEARAWYFMALNWDVSEAMWSTAGLPVATDGYTER